VSGYCLTLLRDFAVADAIERLGGNDTGEIRDLGRRRPVPAHVERHQLDATDGRHPPDPRGLRRDTTGPTRSWLLDPWASENGLDGFADGSDKAQVHDAGGS
jgi:hypothetical protein